MITPGAVWEAMCRCRSQNVHDVAREAGCRLDEAREGLARISEGDLEQHASWVRQTRRGWGYVRMSERSGWCGW